MSDKKTPQEASNIFHSIMKASVKPIKLTDEEIIEAVYKNFNVLIGRHEGVFGYVDTNNEDRHALAKEITLFIEQLKK